MPPRETTMAKQTQEIVINERQAENLTAVIQAGKIDYNDPNLDRRSIKALEKRGLVKLNEIKKGTFVVPTAIGKKFKN